MDNRAAETELAQIDKRLRARAALDAKDRARQRQLLRDLRATGMYRWDDMQDVARVSRTTLRDALR